MQLVSDCGIRHIGLQNAKGCHRSVAALALLRDILRAGPGLGLPPNN